MAYCERSDVEAIFGLTNVIKWADLENEQDDSYIEDRITWACDQATAWMNNRLRGGRYIVPFEEPYDEELIENTAKIAGVKLYDSRGIEDTEEGGFHKIKLHKDQAEEFVRLIMTGRLVLNVVSSTVIPKIVKGMR